MKALLKRAAASCFEEYELYKIYKSPPLESLPAAVDRDGIVELTTAAFDTASPFIRTLQRYMGEESLAVGLYVGADLASAAVFWWGEQYRRRNGFIPLRQGDAKLEQINTDERYRGQGLATRLILGSCRIMRDKGFRRLYARVWHSNRSSRRAFEKAGWTEIGFVAGIRIRSRTLRVSYPVSLLRSLPG